MTGYGAGHRMSRSVMRGFDGDRLRALREKRGLSIAELGRAAGLGRGTVGKWERGAGAPQVDALASVASALGVRIDELVKVAVDDRTLVDWRILTGKTQMELAKELDVSTPALSAMERGEVRLTDARADALAAALGISIDEVQRAFERVRHRPMGTQP